MCSIYVKEIRTFFRIVMDNRKARILLKIINYEKKKSHHISLFRINGNVCNRATKGTRSATAAAAALSYSRCTASPATRSAGAALPSF